MESEIESIGLLIAVIWFPCGSWWILAWTRSKKEEEELVRKKGNWRRGCRKGSLFLIVTRALEPLHFYWLGYEPWWLRGRSNLRGSRILLRKRYSIKCKYSDPGAQRAAKFTYQTGKRSSNPKRGRNISLTHRWNDCANFLDRQIHGFYVPQFNFKSPLIVNRENNAFDERRISTSHLCIPKKETRGKEQDISRWEECLRTSNLDPAPVKRNSLKMDNSEMLRRVEPIFFSRNPWQKSLGALPSPFEESEYFSNGTILRGIFRSR